MTESELRDIICEVGRRMYARNLVAATDGNVSARIGDGLFLCTPSGVSKGYMKPADILVADAQGAKVSGAGKVTSEFFTHLAAYEERPDIGAVVHAHPLTATALTLAGISLEAPVIPEVVVGFGTIPTAPYATPGTREGGEVIRPYIQSGDVLLIHRHGAVTVGLDPLDAYHKMEKLEHAAEMVFATRLLGAEPPALSSDELRRLVACRGPYGVHGRAHPIPGFDY